MITKLSVVQGAFEFLRISGLTVQASNNEIVLGVQTLDDYAAELKATLDVKYIQPQEYGQSDPNDYSGLTAGMAGPMKKLLALQLAPYFGKEIPAMLYKIANDGMRSLENQIVTVGNRQNPSTLPIGSGNERSYFDNKFYTEPDNTQGADNYFEDEVFQFTNDWSRFLEDEYTLDSVVYEFDTGIDLSDESINDNLSVVTISFNRTGQFNLCAKATNSNGDVKVIRKVYNSNKCKRLNTYYP